MRTITEIQSKLCNKLSSDEMALIKGGNSLIAAAPATKAISAVVGVTSAIAATSAIPSIVSDDKRRERPGGGITTL